MFAYSVTVKLDRDAEKDWVAWMRDVHIPDVMATGYFDGYRMHKILEMDTVSERVKYVIRYYFSSLERYEKYQKTAAPKLQKDHKDRYEGRFTASRTVSEVIAGGTTNE